MAKIAERFAERCARTPQRMVGALVDAMPYPVIARDIEYQVVMANRAAEEFYASDILRCKCYEASGLHECLCEECPAEEAFETGRPVEREVRHPETGDHLVIGVYPIFEPDGEPCAIIETVRDVSEARRSEEKIRALLAQVSRANRELTERQRSLDYELRVAREVQMRLVPSGPMCIGRVCFDFLYRPSGQVGGDVFDVVPLKDGRVAMAIADASGHGVGAGLVAVMMRMICRSYGLDQGDPAAVLAAMNEELEQVVPPGQFATAFYAVCDWEGRKVTYAAAGHPMPLLLRSGGDDVERLREAGLPLGSLKRVEYERQTVGFAPADKMLLFTDGVLEAQSAQGERFGYRRLGRLVERQRERSGPEFLHAIVQGVERFIEGREATDDMTIALVESLTEERVEQWRADAKGR